MTTKAEPNTTMNALAGFFAIETPTKTPIAMMVIRASHRASAKAPRQYLRQFAPANIDMAQKGIDN